MALSGAAKGVLIGLVVLLVLVGAGIGYAAWSLGGEPGEGETITFRVEEGQSAAGIAQALQDQEVVRSSLAFRLKARSRGLDRRLAAGTYELETGMSVDQAIDAFLSGPKAPESMSFTIPEGFTVEQILTRLGERTPFSADEYRAVLDSGELEVPDWVPPLDSFPEGVDQPYEGLFFPDTYEVRKDATPQRILQLMIDQMVAVFDQVATDERVASAAEIDLDRYETLILASLVEEEAQVAEERGVIAGVIVNRLKVERHLQIDAANLYAAGFKGRVTSDVRDIDSPYNLYQHVGLPPTPISSPGRAAIEAAFEPEQTEFLYYVKKNEQGEHAFAETFEEHRRNVAEFRKLQEEAERSPEPAPTGS